MALGPSGRRSEPLYVVRMALALVCAAIVGAALGMIWDASGFGGGDATETQAAEN